MPWYVEEVTRSILMNAEVKHRRMGPLTPGFKPRHAWNGKSPTLYSAGQSSAPLVCLTYYLRWCSTSTGCITTNSNCRIKRNGSGLVLTNEDIKWKFTTLLMGKLWPTTDVKTQTWYKIWLIYLYFFMYYSHSFTYGWAQLYNVKKVAVCTSHLLANSDTHK